MNFKKMHGLGNDFVILDLRGGGEIPDSGAIRHICDRHFGVGCDQLVTLYVAEEADIKARFFNPDGSESGACGNATRCIADIVMKEQGRKECMIKTAGGLLKAWHGEDGVVTVDMGRPRHIAVLDLPGSPVGVDMGNPHCVFFVDDVAAVDLAKEGPAIEHHKLFPNRTNVEYVQVLGPDHLRVRVWERGAGITLACGSGACAVAVAAINKGLSTSKVNVELDGGILNLEWREEDDHILMTGPVAYVFDGVLKSD